MQNRPRINAARLGLAVLALAAPAVAQERAVALAQVTAAAPAQERLSTARAQEARAGAQERAVPAGPAARRVAATQENDGSQAGDAKQKLGLTVERARSLFHSADANGSGFVDRTEALRQGLDRPTYAQFDADANEQVSIDEFLVGMRELSAKAGQTVAPDLTAETTRIQALRKARAAQAERRERAAELGDGVKPAEVSPLRGLSTQRSSGVSPLRTGSSATGTGAVSPLRGTDVSPLRGTQVSPLRGTGVSPLRGTGVSPLRGAGVSPLRGADSEPPKLKIPGAVSPKRLRKQWNEKQSGATQRPGNVRPGAVRPGAVRPSGVRPGAATPGTSRPVTVRPTTNPRPAAGRPASKPNSRPERRR